MCSQSGYRRMPCELGEGRDHQPVPYSHPSLLPSHDNLYSWETSLTQQHSRQFVSSLTYAVGFVFCTTRKSSMTDYIPGFIQFFEHSHWGLVGSPKETLPDPKGDSVCSRDAHVWAWNRATKWGFPLLFPIAIAVVGTKAEHVCLLLVSGVTVAALDIRNF